MSKRKPQRMDLGASSGEPIPGLDAMADTVKQFERIKSLETTVLEQADQIESLSAECERYRRVVEQQAAKIERLTWRYDDGLRGGLGANSAGRYCLHCGARESYPHAPGCPAGEE